MHDAIAASSIRSLDLVRESREEEKEMKHQIIDRLDLVENLRI